MHKMNVFLFRLYMNMYRPPTILPTARSSHLHTGDQRNGRETDIDLICVVASSNDPPRRMELPPHNQGRTETCGHPRQANNLTPLHTDILEEFVQHVYSGDGKN
jgi:hypothetical protein